MSPRPNEDPTVHREGGALFVGKSRCHLVDPVRLAAWKAVFDLGHAGRVCDSIVRNRQPPLLLLARLDWPKQKRISVPPKGAPFPDEIEDGTSEAL